MLQRTENFGGGLVFITSEAQFLGISFSAGVSGFLKMQKAPCRSVLTAALWLLECQAGERATKKAQTFFEEEEKWWKHNGEEQKYASHS